MTNFNIARRVAIAIAIVGLAVVPYAIKEVYYVNIASQILLYAIFALGLNILVGYAGLVSLGHAGLFGIAAYVAAYLLVAGHGHALAIIAALVAALVATATLRAMMKFVTESGPRTDPAAAIPEPAPSAETG